MNIGCIIASTPLQVLSACIIAEQYQEYNFDLYIIGNFSSYKEVQDKLNRCKLFNHIKSYELKEIRPLYNKTGISRSVGSLWSYINYRAVGKDIIVKGRNYQIVFYAAAISAIELLFYFQKQYKPRFVMYDDGVMTYRNVNHCLGNEGKVKYIKQIFEIVHGKIKPSLLLYMPELFSELNTDKFSINKLNAMSISVINIAKSIYDISDEDTIDENIIVLECKVDDYLKNEEIKEIEEIYSILDKSYGRNVIYKRHPRDKRELNKNRTYLEGQIPYEVYNMLQDMSEKTLIAWDSTATLTPKLFFDQEPNVILMYRIFNGKQEELNPETHRLYSIFKKKYLKKGKFMIPDTINELIECIKEI